MKSKKRNLDKEYEKFEGFFNTETTINCTARGCKEGYGMYDVDFGFAEEIYKLGWRATGQNCYCPSCSKKFLKKKRN